MSKNNLPDFIPNNNSNLYVRKKNFISDMSYSFTTADDSSKYSDYDIQSPITGSFKPGYTSNPLFKQNTEITNKIIDGTRVEGFNNYGYKDSAPYCGDTVTDIGCKRAILDGQIIPLEKIARNYGNTISKMRQNTDVIGSNITGYNRLFTTLDGSGYFYDFSGNDEIFTKEDDTIRNVMKEDTKQLLLQENDFYIAGSLLTATLLISGIYLAR
jgi:hypothetical protein